MPRTRQQLEQAAADAEKWLDHLEHDDPDVHVDDPADLRAIAYALAAVAAAENAVAEAVTTARRNGRSWGDIAMVLGVSRQAAQKRYDQPAAAAPGA
jgi:hypothetical protein